VLRTDLATFCRCHLNAFSYFGGVPAGILYDNALGDAHPCLPMAERQSRRRKPLIASENRIA